MPNEKKPIFVDILIVSATLLVLTGVVFLFSQTRNSMKQNFYIGKTPDTMRTMNFNGVGKVSVKPDIAMVSMGFSTEKKTVSEAQKESTNIMNSFISKVKTLGIEDKDIKTANYNIYPQYDYTSGKQILRGYQLTQNVNLKIRNLDKVSDILALAGEFNLNQVGDLTFDVDNKEQFIKQAKEDAIKKAKENALETSHDLNIELGRIISLNQYDNTPVIYNGYKMLDSMNAGMGGGPVSPTVSSGNAEISVTVDLTYEIN